MRGGHNILEPGAVGVPVIFGPHMFNFEDVAALALDAGAGLQVYDSAELTEAADSFIRNPELRVAAGRAAQRMIVENQGSLEITLDLIERAVADRAQAAISRGTRVSTGAQIH
jgi:3-deoxy-D-manno-octulosonic-acid transferase